MGALKQLTIDTPRDVVIPDQRATYIRDIFTAHGFDAFINTDNSVSAYIPEAQQGQHYGDKLVTAASRREAYQLIGY